MMDSSASATDPQRQSVAQAKGEVLAWGNAVEARAAVFGSKVRSKMVGLAIGGGIALCFALGARWLLSPRPGRGSLAALRQGTTGGNSASMAGRPDGARLPLGTWLGGLVVARVSRWLIPRAIDAARAALAPAATRRATHSATDVVRWKKVNPVTEPGSTPPARRPGEEMKGEPGRPA